MAYPITFGKYLLLERINVGGMAEVFKAKAFGVEGFERVLAIKRILPSMADDEEFIHMFVDEARIAVQLSHANIVQIYELGKYENQYYIAMEYVSGKDLRQILDRFRKRKVTVPTSAAAYLTSKICEGLDYAHRKMDPSGKPLNLVHRDVSPQNILVSYEGAVKITDFGIAKAEDRASKTQAGVLKGKFGYMSPEQVRGLDIDHRSDLFAVGILMYEMLTGKRLFIGESDFSTLEKVRNAEVVPPSQHNPNIPPELERVMLKALARERDDRYQWASELHDDLQQFLIEENTIYNAKRLSALLRQEFTADIEGELAKMEEFLRMAPPTSEKAVAGARAMKNAPMAPAKSASVMRGNDKPAGEKTMIFESGFQELANAPTQISEEMNADIGLSTNAQRVSPAKAEEHATGSVVIAKERPSRDSKVMNRNDAQSRPVARRSANRDRILLGAAASAFIVLLVVLLVMVLRPREEVATLIIVTQPVDHDLQVLLDGQSLGTRSPIIRDDVKLGKHHLVARAPGYAELALDLNIDSSINAYNVPLNFGRLMNESSGELEVASEPPGAQILVDGSEKGMTPTTIPGLNGQKPVTVIVMKEGYTTYSQSVSFTNGKARVAVTLKPLDPSALAQAEKGHINVESTPSGATVFVNGAVKPGATPTVMTNLDTSRSYEIRVEKKGYKSQTKNVRFDGGTEAKATFVLDADPNADSNPNPVAANPTPVKQPTVGSVQASPKETPRPSPRRDPPKVADRDPEPVKKPTPTVTASPNAGKSVPSGCSGEGAKLSVNVIGEANCQVSIATKKLGAAPVFQQTVPIGKCEVKVTCPSGKTYKTNVALNKGDSEKVIVKPGMWQ